MDEQMEMFDTRKETVLVVGCFDCCHLGHMNFFKAAKKQAHKLIVAIVDDEAIKEKKGNTRPVMKLWDRIEFLKGIKYIDDIQIISSFNPIHALKHNHPDIFFKGSDQTHIDETYAKENNIPIVYLERPDDGYSTTQLITKIKSL